MRAIKFRAWDRHAKKMDYNINLTLTELGDKANLMQFTGLTDKNGKEIYEGDIVRGGEFEETTHKWVYNGDATVVEWSFSYKPGFDFPQMCEVIGNIYESPELLNKEKDNG